MASEEDAIRNVRQVVWRAVDSLATGTGTIQERLESASITLTTLSPARSRVAVGGIERKTRCDRSGLDQDASPRGRAKIRATLRTMSDEEGSKLAKRIFSLYRELRGGI